MPDEIQENEALDRKEEREKRKEEREAEKDAKEQEREEKIEDRREWLKEKPRPLKELLLAAGKLAKWLTFLIGAGTVAYLIWKFI